MFEYQLVEFRKNLIHLVPKAAEIVPKPQRIDKHLLHGIKQFNLDPSKGLEILEQKGFVKIEEESLASFLLNQERLSKKQIGKSSLFHKLALFS